MSIDDSSLTLLFVSSDYELSKATLPKKFSSTNRIVACTTSGEISPALGPSKGSLVGLSFEKDRFLAEIFEFPDLENLDPKGDLKERFSHALAGHRRKLPGSKSFAILLIDGLSTKEEYVVNFLGGALKDIPLVGGSAGDDNKLKETKVFVSDEFRTNAAVLILLSSEEAFMTFKTDHFLPGDTNVVITAADPKRRTVHEIDGYPAIEGYSKALGVKPETLNANLFSANPLLLKLGTDHYIRSIQQVLPDGSLVLYCAIEEGLILTIAHKKDLVIEMENFFRNLDETIGKDHVCLFFECTGRQLEINGLDPKVKEKLSELYRKNNVVGFHTYGEQYCGLHINQTLTGVAIGNKRR